MADNNRKKNEGKPKLAKTKKKKKKERKEEGFSLFGCCRACISVKRACVCVCVYMCYMYMCVSVLASEYIEPLACEFGESSGR